MYKFNLLITFSSFLLLLGFVNPSQAAQFTTQKIIENLDSPRGLTFDTEGNLYIAEAGRGGSGPCIPSPTVQGQLICYGSTGAISRLNLKDKTLKRLITDLPSLALPDSGGDAAGINDLYFNEFDNLYGVIGLAGDPNLRESTLNIPEFGQIISIDIENKKWEPIADLAAFERDNNPDGTDLVSNPYSLIIDNQTIFAIDSGGNSLIKVENSTISVETIFPLNTTANPFPPPTTIPIQTVPTGIAKAPDGTLIIAEYTGFPFPPSQANLYRYQDDLTVLATDFTTIIDVAVTKDGDIYVLEFAKDILNNDFRGSLWLLSEGKRQLIIDQGLTFPTGLAVNKQQEVFIANQGFFAGQGEILKVVTVPEPALKFSLLPLVFSRILIRRVRRIIHK